jgi:hypothetical protein
MQRRFTIIIIPNGIVEFFNSASDLLVFYGV